MNEIDWSKAPEDATHYLPTDVNRCWSACWYKQNSFGRWLGKNASSYDNGWDDGWLIDDDQVEAFVPTLIPRPSSNWSGEGLPTVGTVCEYRINDGGWFKCQVQYILKVIECDYTELVLYCPHLDYDQVVSASSCRFRPIKTQEQIAAEEREKAIKEMYNKTKAYVSSYYNEVQKQVCADLYDAGYRLTKTE